MRNLVLISAVCMLMGGAVGCGMSISNSINNIKDRKFNLGFR